MLIKIDNSYKFGKQVGGFGIQILYPGKALIHSNDTGFATIGRIDHAKIKPNTLVPMHPHQNDEILTYIRSGRIKHIDSEGISEVIDNKKLMLMNAGAKFYHEELVLEEGGNVEALQIFIRPEKENLKPLVQFHDFPTAFSLNQWRKIAGKENEYPLRFRSNTFIQDARLEVDSYITLPEIPIMKASLLLYVFDGLILVNGNSLAKGESLLIEDEHPIILAKITSDIVLFITDKHTTFFKSGMYSGNKM
jgi:redox-sensitive bicupin YhaK (pirin superfamily)